MHKTVACLFQTASKNFAKSGLILFLFFLASKIAWTSTAARLDFKKIDYAEIKLSVLLLRVLCCPL